MPIKKKELIRKECEGFLDSLNNLKSMVSKEDDFLFKLTDFHVNYLKLINILEDNKIKQLKSEKKITNSLVTITLREFTIIFSNEERLLSIDTNDDELDEYLFTRIKKYNFEELEEFVNEELVLYLDYEKYPCNGCGNFLYLDTLSIPLIKIRDDINILSFHRECYLNVKK